MNKADRLDLLEKAIKSNADSSIWIDGHNATIRVDVNSRRGQEVVFPTVYEARIWLEKQINTHAGGVISYSVDNICDLFEDAQAMRAAIKGIIPGTIKVPDLGPKLIDGQIVWQEKTGSENHPSFLSADELPGDLAICTMVPAELADLGLWCLANLMSGYFGNRQFHERFASGVFTPEDGQMFAALFMVYRRARPGNPEEQMRGYVRLIHQAGKLPALEARAHDSYTM
jgi:hypothetical protein